MRAGSVQRVGRPGVRLAWVLALLVAGGCAEPAPGQEDGIGPLDLATRIEQGSPPLILDVRTPEEYEESHVPGAINVPHREIAGRIGQLEAHKGAYVVVYCSDGERAGRAARALRKAGFAYVLRLEGDFRVWRERGFPVAGMP